MDLNERLEKIEDEQKKMNSVLKDIFYMTLNIQTYISPPRKETTEQLLKHYPMGKPANSVQ